MGKPIIHINRTRPRHFAIYLGGFDKIGRELPSGGRHIVAEAEGESGNLGGVAFDDELHIDAAEVECLAWLAIGQLGQIYDCLASGGVENEPPLTRIIQN